jgi:lysophospholipase L1-like esterase
MRKIMGYFLPGVAFLVFLEIALWGLNHIISWDEYIHRAGLSKRKFIANPEYENQFLFLKDPYVIWKLKPGELKPGCRVNKLGFRGDEVSQHKTPGTKRIICLGNSITLGLDVKTHADAYPMLLAQHLKQTQDQPCEVINAGVAGYSSYQILQQWRHYIKPLDPDLIIVLAAFNDVIYTPFKPDKEIRMTKTACAFYNTLFSFRVLRALNSGIKFISAHISHKELISSYDPKIGIQTRVSEEDYRKNLEGIVKDAEARQINVIFITSNSVRGIPLAVSPLPRIESEGKKNVVHWIPQPAPSVIRVGRENVERLYRASQAQMRELPESPIPYYNLAKCCEYKGDSLLSRAYFNAADSLDTTKKRYDRYNQIMREVAAEHTIPVVDAYQLLNGGDNSRYFTPDCIHFNEAGHAVIAEALYRQVVEILD